MILDELASYIQANSTLVAGTNLFKAHHPADAPATSAAIYEGGGVGPARRFNGSVVHEQPLVQVVTRSTSYVTARALAQEVYDLFVSIVNSTLSSVRYLDLEPQQSPFPIGTDELARHMISCNYIVRKELS